MRRLIWLIVILCALWSGWWALAANGIGRGVAHWQSVQHAQGWQADLGAVVTTGYPFSLTTQVSDIAVADPSTGVAMELDSVEVSAPAYWPGYLTLTLPETFVHLSAPDGKVFIQAPGAKANLRLHPGASLELEHLSAAAGAWQVNTPAGNLVAADTLLVEMTQDAARAETYHMTLNADALTPGDVLRHPLSLPADWPLAFETIAADLSVTFDAPLDRTAVETRRPQPRAVQLHTAEAAWGPLRLAAKGAVMIDADGVPTGDVTLQAENWKQMLDLAEGGGVLPSAMRPQAETLLGMLATLGGNPDALDLSLRFQDGQMFLGPIRLGPAPRIILR